MLQCCSGAGTVRNGVPVKVFEVERRSGKKTAFRIGVRDHGSKCEKRATNELDNNKTSVAVGPERSGVPVKV